MLIILTAFCAGLVIGCIVTACYLDQWYGKRYKKDVAFTVKKNRELMEQVMEFKGDAPVPASGRVFKAREIQSLKLGDGSTIASKEL